MVELWQDKKNGIISGTNANSVKRILKKKNRTMNTKRRESNHDKRMRVNVV